MDRRTSRALDAAFVLTIVGVANARERAMLQREEKDQKIILEHLRANSRSRLFDKAEWERTCKSCGTKNDEIEWSCWMCGGAL
jgi:hypothetical protein